METGSCLDLKKANPAATSGSYSIWPKGAKNPIKVHCDMTSDGGGYTMVRFTSSSLGTNQTAYRTLCASHGMEVFVPRTKTHALAMLSYRLQAEPSRSSVHHRVPTRERSPPVAVFRFVCGMLFFGFPKSARALP